MLLTPGVEMQQVLEADSGDHEHIVVVAVVLPLVWTGVGEQYNTAQNNTQYSVEMGWEQKPGAASAVGLGEVDESAEGPLGRLGSPLADWRRAASPHSTGAVGGTVVVEAGIGTVVVAVVGEIVAAEAVVAVAVESVVVVPTLVAGRF